jgi:peptidyl-prolyl cis-trans isomerase SurA
MKQFFYTALISLAMAASLSLPKQVFANDQLLDKVIAVVNDQIILKSELSSRMFEQAQAMAAQGIEVKDTQALREKVLNAIVMETLQLERANRIGLKASDDEINQQLEALAEKNGLSLFELRNQLNLQAPNGFQVVRNQIKNQILIQKLREREVISQAYVTESEIQNYLQRQSLANSNIQLKLQHILIALPESATPEQRQQALDRITKLKTRINAGESFSQLAVRHSDGGNALQGGDLGWMAEEEVPTFFADALEGLVADQVSDIIESASGFHLVKLVEKKDLGSSEVKTEYHLYRFVVLSDNADPNNVPKEIVQITQNMDSIQDFQALFNRYSDIPETVNANSDLGWRTIDAIPEVIRADLAKMPIKTAMPPLLTNNGWMILYLDDVREVNQANETERQKAVQTIRMRKANEMFDLWLLRLKDEAFIQYKD